jgi:hypothetical protein
MTEVEWLEGTDPAALLVELVQGRGRASERKLRLYACSVVRRVWHLLPERSRQAVEVSERFADEPRLVLDLLDAQQEAEEALRTAWRLADEARLAYDAHLIDDAPGNEGADLCAEDGYQAYDALAFALDARSAAQIAIRVTAYRLDFRDLLDLLPRVRRLVPGPAGTAAQCRLLREIVGNPFRPVRVNPAWLCWGDGIVRQLAWGVYEEGVFERLPILGDALEEAGCTDRSLLDHCREPGPHVRGCWIVDLVLDKS